MSLHSVSPYVSVFLLCCEFFCLHLFCYVSRVSPACLRTSLCSSVFPLPLQSVSLYFLCYFKGLRLMLVYSVLLPCLVMPNLFHLYCHLFHVPSCSCLLIYSVCHLVLVAGSSVFFPCISLCNLPASSCIAILGLHFVTFFQFKFLLNFRPHLSLSVYVPLYE